MFYPNIKRWVNLFLTTLTPWSKWKRSSLQRYFLARVCAIKTFAEWKIRAKKNAICFISLLQVTAHCFFAILEPSFIYYYLEWKKYQVNLKLILKQTYDFPVYPSPLFQVCFTTIQKITWEKTFLDFNYNKTTQQKLFLFYFYFFVVIWPTYILVQFKNYIV